MKKKKLKFLILLSCPNGGSRLNQPLYLYVIRPSSAYNGMNYRVEFFFSSFHRLKLTCELKLCCYIPSFSGQYIFPMVRWFNEAIFSTVGVAIASSTRTHNLKSYNISFSVESNTKQQWTMKSACLNEIVRSGWKGVSESTPGALTALSTVCARAYKYMLYILCVYKQMLEWLR